MRIVVSGGTGFVGREIVRQLLERDAAELVVTSRAPAEADDWDGRVRLVQAFAGDPVSLGRAFGGAEVVVHCMQFPNHPVQDRRSGRTYLEIDGRGTALAAAVARRVGVRRFVYLSGAGAGQGRPQAWFRAKDLAEAAVRESGLEHVLLRPSWIYGPRDRSLNRFVFFCRHLPCVPVIGDGRTRVDPIHVDDVAYCAVEAALRPEVRAETFELGGPERLSMDEIVRTLQRVLGRRRPILHHPVPLMKLLAWPLQWLPQAPLSPEAVEFVTQEVPVDPGPAQRFCGRTFVSFEQGLRRYL